MESRLLHASCVAHFVGWDVCGFGSPGSASPSPGAITLSASFAGWLNDSLESNNLRTCYTEQT